MKLQTQIPLTPENHQINYDSKVLLLGSCFTENIGEKLEYYKFQNFQNPFGIIFHPLAIQKLIERAVTKKLFAEDDIFEQDGLWHCLEVHSLVFHANRETYLQLLNDTLDALLESLKEATHIVITCGSAWGYRYLKTGEIVANCHKIPQKKFSKEITSVDGLTESIRRNFENIRSQNPEATIIYTVSPVRHLKDGFVENTQSKAHLLAAIHEYRRNNMDIHYFPAYEIMMDELRDYRFYTEDMLHPNKTAIDIIWERFSSVWIDPETATLRKEIASIRTGLEHRPFNPDSASHKDFRMKLQQKIEEIQKELPHLKF